MSKKRSISKKVNLSNFPLPETSHNLPNSKEHSSEPCIQEIYFGERIKSPSCSSTISKSSDIFNSDEGFRDLLSYKSSASSTSGSEDIEIEATRKVTEEFEKLDKVLYGESSTNITKENEYEQWTSNFPHLRIIGSAMKIHPSSEESTEEEFYEEIIAEHSDGDYCRPTEENNSNTKKKIKEAVINNVLKDVKSKLSNKSQPCKSYSVRDMSSRTRTRKLSDNSSSIKESDNNEISEPFLQVSTIPLQTSPFHKPNFEYQNPIMKSHLSASKWQKEDFSSEYSSLPHISISSVPYNSSKGSRKISPLSANKSERSLNNYSANSRRKSSTSRTQSKLTYSPREKSIVLPPIQNLCIDEGRSMSTTPRKFHTRPVSNKYQKYFDEKK